VVAVVAAGAFVTTAAPTFATSISEFSTGISFPAGQITYGADGNVWFTEPAGNRIGKITPAGAVTEYTAGITAGAGLGGIALGPDGNVWFTEATAGNIGTITPAGTVTEYPAAAGGSPMGITAGSDGNLWFTEPKVGSGSDAIGRMTTTGTLLTITAGVTNGTTPMAITSGSDGNVWFTEQSGGRIGRVAIPADTITEFAAGLAPLSLEAITSGSD
jgi:virginiamycin B lyase